MSDISALGLGRMGSAREQEIEILAKHFFSWVTGQGEKAVIGKNDWIARISCIGKQHRHARGFCGNDKRAEMIVEAFNFSFRMLLLFGLFYDLWQNRITPVICPLCT